MHKQVARTHVQYSTGGTDSTISLPSYCCTPLYCNLCASNIAPTAVAASTLSSLNASSLTFTWNAPTDTTACAYIYSVCLYQQRSSGQLCESQCVCDRHHWTQRCALLLTTVQYTTARQPLASTENTCRAM